MIAAEIERLKNQGLSHVARTLYILYLREFAIQEQYIVLDYGYISYNLTSYSGTFPCELSYDNVNNLIKELLSYDLIEIVNTQSNSDFNGATIRLPFLQQEQLQLPSLPFLMHPNWQPSPSFYHNAKYSGLSDTNYTMQDLNAFISYWMNKHEYRNQVGWERAFIQRLIRQKKSRISQDGSLYRRY